MFKFSLNYFSILGGIAISLSLSSPSLADPLVNLQIKNQCSHPIKIAILVVRYVPRDKTAPFYEDGWWELKPGEQRLIIDDRGQPILVFPKQPDIGSSNRYYAETTDGSNIVWEGHGVDGYRTSNLPNAIRLSDGSKLRYRVAYIGSNGILTLACSGK